MEDVAGECYGDLVGWTFAVEVAPGEGFGAFLEAVVEEGVQGDGHVEVD